MRNKKEEGEAPPRVPLRRIMAFFAPYRWPMLGLLGLVLLQGAVNVSAPFLLREILDRAIPRRELVLLTVLALGMLASAAGTAVLGAYTARVSTVVGQGVMHTLRVRVYDHLGSMSLAFFTRTRSGDTISRITNDIGGVDSVVSGTATALVQNSVTAIAVAVALLVLEWKLAVIALVVVPGMLLLTPRLGRRRRAVVGRRQRRLSGLTSLVTESLSVSGVLLAKTSGDSAEMRRRFAAESQEVSRLEIASAMIGRWTGATRRASLVAVPAVVYWLAGMEVAHGVSPASLGTIVAFTSMLNRLVGPVTTVQSVGQGVSTSMALFGRIFEVLDLPADIADRPGARPLAVPRGEVELRDVWFSYADAGSAAEADAGADRAVAADADRAAEAPSDAGDWTLRAVDVRVRPGGTLAIVGATGSGKTTMAYLLARLYEPTRGAVRIDGTDLRDVTLASVSGAVGLVAQETYLFHDTIAANLRFAAPDATDEELVDACRAARIHDAIAALPGGYGTVVGERGFRFSGGERQRIAIARMVLRNPPVLILDEATSALDTATEREVQAALDALAAGRTTIAIAHRLSTVRAADEIVVLDAGRVVERGTHDELAAAGGRYTALLHAPDGVGQPVG